MLRVALQRGPKVHWSRSPRLRAAVIGIANRLANFRNVFSGPRVTMPQLRGGNVGVALAVHYSPFDEAELEQRYPGTPRPYYLTNIAEQLGMVKEHVEDHHSAVACWVTNPRDMNAAIDDCKLAMVPCIEGGFQVGAQPGGAAEPIADLAELGVAYITVAHLFYRKLATNANAIPFIPNFAYDHFWPQPEEVGLTSVGEEVIRAMVEEGILIDVTHMSQWALDDTFALLEAIEDKKEIERNSIPVIASHGAVRLDGSAYNLSPATIRKIRDRNGVIGLILSEKLMTPGTGRWRTCKLRHSLDVMFRHIEAVREHCDGSYRHIGIGTDLDGFIKPTLAGLGDALELARLEDGLIAEYGKPIAAEITSGNALRVLRAHWRRPGTLADPAAG